LGRSLDSGRVAKFSWLLSYSVPGIFRRQRSREIDKVTVIDNRQLTVNNGFVMPGVGRPQVAVEQPEIDSNEVEILPDPDDFHYDYNEVETSFKIKLKDRF